MITMLLASLFAWITGHPQLRRWLEIYRWHVLRLIGQIGEFLGGQLIQNMRYVCNIPIPLSSCSCIFSTMIYLVTSAIYDWIVPKRRGQAPVALQAGALIRLTLRPQTHRRTSSSSPSRPPASTVRLWA